MPFLFKKKSRGKTYYFIGENKRVQGKVVRAWEVYVGTVDKILNMVRKTETKSQIQEVEVSEFGHIAAVLDICQRLKLRQLVNKLSKKNRNQGYDVGTYFILMLINRCVAAKSKRKLSSWYKRTFLQRYFGIPAKKLTSQRFWDHMQYFSPEIIEQLEKSIVKNLLEEFDINLDCLLYDPTNFATYISHHPKQGNLLPQYGNSKQKRFDLLQVNLALLVTRDYGIPLLHEIYSGNINDVSQFKLMLKRIIQRYEDFEQIELPSSDLTLIFDKGNNSKDAIEELRNSKYHFIASLRPSTQKDLLDIRLEDYLESWEDEPSKVVKAYRSIRKIYGKETLVILTYYQPSAKAAEKALTGHLLAAEKKFLELSDKVGKPYYRTKKSIESKTKKITSKKHVKGLFTVSVEESDDGQITFSWQRNDEAIKNKKKNFGKSILYTDQYDWSTKEIVWAYRSQWRIERDFNELKDADYIRAFPIYHWTDQKIRVHFFICVLALLIQRLLHRELGLLGIDWSIGQILDTLKEIREVGYLFTDNLKVQYKITKLSKDQQKLFHLLKLGRYSNEIPENN